MVARLLLAGAIIGCAARAVAAPLSIEDFKYIADRSPTVFDVFFHFQRIYEDRLPRVMFTGDLMIGPTYDIPTRDGPFEARIAGGRMSLGSVPYSWGERAGFRAGIDGFSTNLTPKGSPMADGWGYRSGLLYVGAFDRAVGWSATFGLYLTARPAVEQVGDQLVFGTEGTKTTVNDKVAGFVHGTIPWIDTSVGLIFDGDGVRQIRGKADVAKIDLWESMGPVVGIFPQLEHYQFGAHATRFRAWSLPITVSTEVVGRYESGVGAALDHFLFGGDVTFFEDKPDRQTNFRHKEFTTDFHLRVAVHGSYFNMPEVSQDWGMAAQLDLLSMGLWRGEWRFTLGGSYNSYEDLILLPLPEVLSVKMIISAGW